MNKNNIASRVKAIKKRCDKARLGPWLSYIEGRDHTSGSSFIMIGQGEARQDDLYLTGDVVAVPTADVDFIAHAREDVPFLLAEIERLNGLLYLKPNAQASDDPREATIQAECLWLLSLPPDLKVKFLAKLSYFLTISARDTYEPQTENLLRPSHLRRINEIQHRVLQALTYVTCDASEEDYERAIVENLVGETDAEFRNLTDWAWKRAKHEAQL